MCSDRLIVGCVSSIRGLSLNITAQHYNSSEAGISNYYMCLLAITSKITRGVAESFAGMNNPNF